jgi:hypothetical protein
VGRAQKDVYAPGDPEGRIDQTTFGGSLCVNASTDERTLSGRLGVAWKLG